MMIVKINRYKENYYFYKDGKFKINIEKLLESSKYLIKSNHVNILNEFQLSQYHLYFIYFKKLINENFGFLLGIRYDDIEMDQDELTQPKFSSVSELIFYLHSILYYYKNIIYSIKMNLISLSTSSLNMSQTKDFEESIKILKTLRSELEQYINIIKKITA